MKKVYEIPEIVITDLISDDILNSSSEEDVGPWV